MALPTLSAWLREQPFHLALSAGFFGFFAHGGLLAALEEQGLAPASISGSSAGALIGGLWSSGISTSRIREELAALRRQDFWDPAPGPGLLRGALFRARVERLLQTDSFDHTRVPFSASVFDLRALRTIVLRSGSLSTAICASCALPGMFHPVWIDGHPCVDGGVADRPAHAAIPAHARVLYHHLASQSPWRARAPAVPVRPHMVAVVLPGLPRPGPFHLERGTTAFDAARARTRTLLDVTVDPRDGTVLRDLLTA
ncbi:MAG: patatin-like phospholipase family protein [Deltaproteobacteria bacterium]|nr:patatin-like phospholipase family protein [Deltaproteobacteria bacterium]